MPLLKPFIGPGTKIKKKNLKYDCYKLKKKSKVDFDSYLLNTVPLIILTANDL